MKVLILEDDEIRKCENVMKIGITGTRKGMTDKQKIMVRSAFTIWDLTEFHHGDCIGADAEAGDIAVLHNALVHIHPPIDPKYRAFCSGDVIYPEKLYLDRDKDIVNSVSYMLATPKGFNEELRSGTWATIRYSMKIKRRLTIIYPDGSLSHSNCDSLLF